MRYSPNSTGTVSSCSCGKTSRNHPTQPATARTMPRILTDALVRRPANIKAKPKDKTIGHAVDAGTSISAGARVPFSTCFTVSVAISFSSTAQNINHSENNYPNGIYKMPVQGKYVDTSGLLRTNSACEPEEQHNAQHDQSRDDVKGMQANQRVVRRSKKVRGNGQSMFGDQSVPFLASTVKKEGAKY